MKVQIHLLNFWQQEKLMDIGNFSHFFVTQGAINDKRFFSVSRILNFE
jgi:hypothetical protein